MPQVPVHVGHLCTGHALDPQKRVPDTDVAPLADQYRLVECLSVELCSVFRVQILDRAAAIVFVALNRQVLP